MKQKSLNSWEKIASLCILDVYKMLLYGDVVKQASTEMMKDFCLMFCSVFSPIRRQYARYSTVTWT